MVVESYSFIGHLASKPFSPIGIFILEYHLKMSKMTLPDFCSKDEAHDLKFEIRSFHSKL
jgi:hypothetical protein